MENTTDESAEPQRPLRYGWTTGACATAAARAAVEALWTGIFPDPVTITLPGGQQPQFVLAEQRLGQGFASAAIVKDAGDDPDVTHGALVVATVSAGPPGSGVTFRAGPGVGTVTRPGLPVPPNQPAINPVPRRMIASAIETAAAAFSKPGDIVVEIAIPGGEELAQKTLNPRLGVVGGLSILGTTGIVVPFSCSAWIHSIHRGIDVARACGITHVAGATGSTSEAGIAALYRLPEIALIDMGDFAGGMLKYLKSHPIARVTVAGGFAKMSKLAQGRMDLHSRRGAVDLEQIGDWLREAGAPDTLVAETRSANTAMHALAIAEREHIDVAGLVAGRAAAAAARTMAGSGIGIDVVVFDREGTAKGRSAILAA